jgi:hypothetical protein
MATMNTEHRKALVKRIAAELMEKDPTDAAIKEAFFRLQPVTVPDGFRINTRGWDDICSSVIRGVRISIGHAKGAKKRIEETGTPKVADAPLKNVEEPKPTPLPQFTKIDRMEEAVDRLTEEMAGIRRIMLRIATALEAQASKGFTPSMGKPGEDFHADFEGDEVNGNVDVGHPLDRNPDIRRGAAGGNVGRRFVVEPAKQPHHPPSTTGMTAMQAAFIKADVERARQQEYGRQQQDH